MKVLFKEELQPSSFQQQIPNYYEVIVYGNKEILNYFDGWDDKRPDPICEVTAKLIGKIKNHQDKEYNNLTLTHKSIKYIYERNQESN